MGKPAKKEEVKKPGTAVGAAKASMVMVQADIPDYIKQDKQRGSEGVKTDDLIIPRLEIVQALSPCLKKADPGYIEGSEQGMMFNSVSRKLYGDQVFVVPVWFAKQWLVWKDRKHKDGGNGGFFGAFNTPEEAYKRAETEGGEAKGIITIDTPQQLCLLLDMETGKIEEIMVSMPRSKAKISRQWNSLVRSAGGDRFSRVYQLGTSEQKGPKGDFWNMTVAVRGFPSKEIYTAAEDLYIKIAAGERAVTMDTKDFNVDDEGGDSKM